MKIIGISGSYGKTTVAYLLHLYLDNINKSNKVYSSLDYEVAVPNNDRLNEIIEEESKNQIDYLILEINEEYIGKINLNIFDYKVLTNVSVITKVNEYEEYKNRLLSFYDNKCTNILCYSPEIERDEYLSFIDKLDNKSLFGSSYEIEKYNIDRSIFYSLIYNDNKPIDEINGISFSILSEGKKLNIESKMMFDYSAYNINCLYAIINTLKLYQEDTFFKTIENPNIPGRCEKIIYKDRIILITLTIVDILEYLYNYKKQGSINDIILVIGSIGIGHNTWNDEFNSKEQEEKLKHARRYAMNYACRYSDFIYLTSSDPASSDPYIIANEMESYLINNHFFKTKIEIDRYNAIKDAIINSNVGDVIIISGRGNRKKYIKENKEYSFSDFELIQKVIKELGWR